MNTVSHIVKVNSKQIHYKLLNSDFRDEVKPVLVFLHEGLGSVAQWKDFPDKVSSATGCAALVYDRYGYGHSEAINETRNADYMPDEAFVFLPELLKQSGINEKVILIGHSDGGTIALLYATRFQEKTMAVITEADHVLSEAITLAGVKNIVEEYKNGGLKKLLSRFHDEKTDSMFYSWSNYWLSEEKTNWSIENHLPQIKCPVLAMQGRNDCYGSVKQLTSKLENIKSQVEILLIPECGHVPHFEATRMVLEKMISFIKRTCGDI